MLKVAAIAELADIFPRAFGCDVDERSLKAHLNSSQWLSCKLARGYSEPRFFDLDMLLNVGSPYIPRAKLSGQSLLVIIRDV